MVSKQLPLIIALVGFSLMYLYRTFSKKQQLLEEQLYYIQKQVEKLSLSLNNNDTNVISLDDIQEVPDYFQVVDYGYENENENENSEKEQEPEAIESNMDSIREITEEVTPTEDIVITKLSHCSHILKKGKNKGMICGKQADESGVCKNHISELPQPL
jgi:hypothetical protein